MSGPLQDLYLGDALATALYHVHEEGTPVTPYAWDRTRMRYRSTLDGQEVDPTDVRAGVEAVYKAVQRELERLAQEAAAGDMDPVEWRSAMEGQMAALHQVASLAATGGVGAQDVASLRSLAERVQGELAYLDGFAGDLFRSREGSDAYTGAQAGARAAQYASAAVPTYEGARHRLIMEDPDEGYDVARRVLMPDADHCDPCVALAGDGLYVPVAHIVAIGATPCRSNCECTIEYARSDTLRPDEFAL